MIQSPDSENPTEFFLQIDEEGFLFSNDIKVVDENYAQEILQNIWVTETFTVKTKYEDNEIYIEAFDEPFIAKQVHIEGEKAFIQTAYDLTFEFDLKSLCLDEWDRFHGLAFNPHNKSYIPFVFSRSAQADFFNLLEEYDDDTITWNGQVIEIDSYFPNKPELEKSSYWTKIYKEEVKPGWDLKQATPSLIDMIPRLKLMRSKVIVLGCGEGHDAALFAQAGHLVTAVDFSEEALDRARKNYPDLKINWVQADVLKLPVDFDQQFDIVFEHTCFCAINPAHRNKMVTTYRRLLHSQGQFMGVFFTMPKRIGPPFGASEWELRERLKKSFQFLFWGRWHQSVPQRQGKELFVFAQKRSEIQS